MARSKRLAWALLGPGYLGSGRVHRTTLVSGGGSVEILQSGNPHTERIFLLSPGFGAALTDYGPIVSQLESLGLVIRLRHSGSDRWAGLWALLKMYGLRLRGSGKEDALQTVRAWIHSESHRRKRLRELETVASYYAKTFAEHQISVVGHSFGTDTALLFALQHEVERLYLFSNHPPGYLIPESEYASLRANNIWVFSGTKDVTRDGVGPEERLKIVKHLDGRRIAGVHCFEGVAHMDFAFEGWGPPTWKRELKRVI